jgi:hypothetical protein
MRRLLGAAALAGVCALALPVPSASACTPMMPLLDVSRERVVRGGSLHVSGDVRTRANGDGFGCHNPVPPSLSPTPTVGVAPSPDPTPSESPDPLASLVPTMPALVPVAYARAVDPTVVLTIQKRWEWTEPEPPDRVLTRVAEDRPRTVETDVVEHTFGADVTVPLDLTPGKYVLRAHQEGGLFFGIADITVLDELAATGDQTARLAGIAVLLIVTGALAVATARSASSPRRGWTASP